MLSVLLGFLVIIAAVSPFPGMRTLPGAYLSAALSEPLKVFMAKYGRSAAPILALICVYRLSDFVINIMNPFYLDLGFTLTEVAEVRKVFGVVATMAGVLAGGWAVARFGMLSSLLAGAIAGPSSNLVFIWLATQGHALSALFVAIAVENVLAGFAGTCLIAYMSSLTTAGFTATQYALFSSLYALPGKILASQSGRIVEAAAHNAEAGGMTSMLIGLFANLPPESFADAMEKSGVSPAALASGYVTFFIYSTAIGLVAIVLTFVVKRQQQTRS
jgi:PAT family beta-lactamase induction signal transducer AmpG